MAECTLGARASGLERGIKVCGWRCTLSASGLEVGLRGQNMHS